MRSGQRGGQGQHRLELAVQVRRHRVVVGDEAPGLRVGHGQHDGRAPASPATPATSYRSTLEVGGQVLDERPQPTGRAPAQRTGLGDRVAVAERAERVGPRPGEAALAPVLDDREEVVVRRREVRRAEVDRAVPQPPRGHPAAGPVAAVEHPDRHPGRPQLPGARHARQPGTDDHDPVHTLARTHRAIIPRSTHRARRGDRSEDGEGAPPPVGHQQAGDERVVAVGEATVDGRGRHGRRRQRQAVSASASHPAASGPAATSNPPVTSRAR